MIRQITNVMINGATLRCHLNGFFVSSVSIIRVHKKILKKEYEQAYVRFDRQLASHMSAIVCVNLASYSSRLCLVRKTLFFFAACYDLFYLTSM